MWFLFQKLEDSSEYSEVATPSGGTKRKLNSRKGDTKTCMVCGDTALGCNFDAISCESCKAFFRRNALKEKVNLSLLMI